RKLLSILAAKDGRDAAGRVAHDDRKAQSRLGDARLHSQHHEKGTSAHRRHTTAENAAATRATGAAMSMNDDQILELLCERFPRTFMRDPAGRVPLKRGIDRDLVVRLDGLSSRTALKRVLGSYTACAEYRARLLEGAVRIDLDGKPAGAVTAGEAAYALAPKPAKTKPASSTSPAPPPKSKRLSLDDLRRAARQRKGLT